MALEHMCYSKLQINWAVLLSFAGVTVKLSGIRVSKMCIN